jgi:hypothetical protein
MGMEQSVESSAVEPKYAEKTCPSATLSTTNPTLLDPDRRGGKPVTNRLSYGSASFSVTVYMPIKGAKKRLPI